MITSMMDMFTIILIFLLFQFSEKPETIHMREDIELPQSTAKMDHTETIKLVLTQKGLHINDDLIARVRKGRVIGLDAQNLKASVLYIVSLDWRIHGLPGGSGLVSDCHADAGSQ